VAQIAGGHKTSLGCSKRRREVAPQSPCLQGCLDLVGRHFLPGLCDLHSGEVPPDWDVVSLSCTHGHRLSQIDAIGAKEDLGSGHEGNVFALGLGDAIGCSTDRGQQDSQSGGPGREHAPPAVRRSARPGHDLSVDLHWTERKAVVRELWKRWPRGPSRTTRSLAYLCLTKRRREAANPKTPRATVAIGAAVVSVDRRAW
jgi:hypothetical protein